MDDTPPKSYTKRGLEIKIPADNEECKITKRSEADKSYRTLMKSEFDVS
jgi:hypothetical protein